MKHLSRNALLYHRKHFEKFLNLSPTIVELKCLFVKMSEKGGPAARVVGGTGKDLSSRGFNFL